MLWTRAAGHDTMYQPPTASAAQVSLWSLAALRLSQAPWTADELGEVVVQMHPHDSH